MCISWYENVGTGWVGTKGGKSENMKCIIIRKTLSDPKMAIHHNGNNRIEFVRDSGHETTHETQRVGMHCRRVIACMYPPLFHWQL